MLEQTPAKFEAATQITQPTKQQLRQEITESRINLAQFYQLRDCPIQAVIAERNTTLGKLHSPSRRYLYEVGFLQTLALCQQNNTLPIEVKQWLLLKQQQLPKVWANLISTSEEMLFQLASQSGFIRGDDSDGLNQVKQALDYLLQLQKQPDSNSRQLEQQLKVLLDFPLLVQMWRSQQLLANNLEQTTNWLQQQHLQQSCSAKQQPPQKIQYLANVFRLFFIQKIQPTSSRLNYYHYQLQPKVQQLIQSPELTPEFKQFLQQHYKQGFLHYQLQMQKHIQFWQALFRQCNLTFTQR